MAEAVNRFSPALKISIIYTVFSASYILLSDRMVADIAKNSSRLNQQLQTYKGIGFILLSGILLFLLSQYYFKRLNESFVKKAELLNHLNETKEKYYEQQLYFRRTLSLSVIEAQESERNRWAEELHDNALQLLTVAKLYLDMSLTQEDKLSNIKESRSLLLTAIDEIRTISHNIKPPHFETMSLTESVNLLLDNIRRFRHYNFSIDLPEKIVSGLNADQKLMVYRILQEQLNNILKYADAENIGIKLTVEGNLATLSITDDGKGFDTSVARLGIGITNMQSRVHPYSGTLEINSSPGHGCELVATFEVV